MIWAELQISIVISLLWMLVSLILILVYWWRK